jgi:hypothetical protein
MRISDFICSKPNDVIKQTQVSLHASLLITRDINDEAASLRETGPATDILSSIGA